MKFSSFSLMIATVLGSAQAGRLGNSAVVPYQFERQLDIFTGSTDTPAGNPPACASSTPAGATPSIHETVCVGGPAPFPTWNNGGWDKVPQCGAPGQEQAFQGNFLIRSTGPASNPTLTCQRINICHRTQNQEHWDAITIDRDGLDGHAGAAHSDRSSVTGQVDYFPGAGAVPNPRGAAYKPGRLVFDSANGGRCLFDCQEIECFCPAEVTCPAPNDGVKVPLKTTESTSTNCVYEKCPEVCPPEPTPNHPDFGKFCALDPDQPNDDICDYKCCNPMNYWCPTGLEGTCSFVAETSNPLTDTCNFNCNAPYCLEPCPPQECPNLPGVFKITSGTQHSGCLYDDSPCDPTTPGPCVGGGCGTFGDPHFMTWGGQFFDYMGECDIVLAESKEFGLGLGLTIHVRAKARYDYSYIESAAVMIGDDVFEVSGYGAFMLNGVSGVELPTKIGADTYSLTREAKNDHDVTFIIEVSESEHIQIKAFKDLVSVRFFGAEEEHFHDVVGIMGNFQNGTRLSRDGLQVIEDDNQFGQEWMVRPGEDPELFQVKSSHPLECRVPNAVKEGRRRLGESISVEAAMKACEKLGVRGAIDACVYDVIATGDLSVAEAGAY